MPRLPPPSDQLGSTKPFTVYACAQGGCTAVCVCLQCAVVMSYLSASATGETYRRSSSGDAAADYVVVGRGCVCVCGGALAAAFRGQIKTDKVT